MSELRTTQDLLRHASALREAERFAEAAEAYARVLALRPDLADSWYNLGFVQARLGRYVEALASYQEALDRGVSGAEEAHLNRAVIFADHLRRDEEAESELKAALARNPAYAPALINLGNLHEDRGRRAEAVSVYERALAVDPDNWGALARLVGLKAADADASLLAAARNAIGRADVGAGDKASLGFALGKALDARGAFEEAFAAYEGANRASRASAGGVLYDRAAHEALIDQVAAAFPGRVAAREDGPAPIFICGMFRSGSTLAEQVLGAHPRVSAGGELPFVPEIAGKRLAPFPQAALGASDEAFAALAAEYRRAVATLFPDADVLTDKRPDNYLYIGLIKRLFPNARIVHTTREALDNCLSIYFLHLDQGMSYALDLADIGHHYRCYQRLMAHWEVLYGADILTFEYDAFVREPRPALERLLAFCGLEWDEACLSFHDARSSVKTASVWQVREPLYQRSSGRWRNYEAHLAPLRAALGL